MPNVELTLLALYLSVGPLTWLLYGALMFVARYKMLLLVRPPKPLKSSAPLLSLIVPAKDEGERIRACIESALAQDYPNIEVIAINDRSIDNTGQIMDEIAATNPRLRVVHIQDGTLGPGWTGKNNALQQGQKHARGEWLLFVDSDVVLQPDAATGTLSISIQRNYDLLSLLPQLESHTLWESLLVPLAGAAASTMYLISRNNEDKSRDYAFANGQFLLIRRSVYDAIGQHEFVKDRFCEDVAIAREVKRQGFRSRVAYGKEWCRVRMYSSLPSIFKGWSRIYYAAPVGDPRPTINGILFVVLCCFCWLPAIGWTIYRLSHPTAITWIDLGWPIAAALHTLAMLVFVSFIYAWTGNPITNSLLLPVSLPMLLMIMLRALRMCVTKKVEWRGTSYSHQMADLNAPRAG